MRVCVCRDDAHTHTDGEITTTTENKVEATVLESAHTHAHKHNSQNEYEHRAKTRMGPGRQQAAGPLRTSSPLFFFCRWLAWHSSCLPVCTWA